MRWIDRKGLFGAGGLGSAYPGHGDFSGSDIFDYNLEDIDPNTNPYTHPEGHFRDLGQSEADVAAAIASCNKDAFQRAMHRGQDFYTHYNKGFRWGPGQVWVKCAGFGHACFGTTADEDVDAWWDAEMWTQARLKEWEEKCGCKK